MDVSDRKFQAAVRRGETSDPSRPRACIARYAASNDQIVVEFHDGMELRIPRRLIQGLAEAPGVALTEIEISPSGLGLHWPRLDVDLYLPSVMLGHKESQRLIAQRLGAAGGRTRSRAKAAAARRNGARGGRPRRDDTA
jgi:hypothetical protein